MNLIKELRLEKGLTQAALAKEMNIAQNTLSTWENGKYEPDNKSLIDLASFFRVSVDYLLGEAEQKEEPVSNERQALENKLLDKIKKLPPDALERFDYMYDLALEGEDDFEKLKQMAALVFPNHKKE